MAEGARSLLGGSCGLNPASNPLMGRGGKSRSLPRPSSSSSTSLQQTHHHQPQTPPASPKQPPTPTARGSPPGHCFRRVTLTKPTFCHCCTDFIWGLAGYLCEGKQILKIYDGNDAVKHNQYRLITLPRIAKNEEVVEAALRAYYINDDQQDYKLQTFTQQALFCDDIINRNDTTEEVQPGSVFREAIPEAWVIRPKPKENEVIKIYPGWLKFVFQKAEGTPCVEKKICLRSLRRFCERFRFTVTFCITLEKEIFI